MVTDCIDTRVLCLCHQPIFWLAAAQHAGLGEATASQKHRSQKGLLESHPNNSKVPDMV